MSTQPPINERRLILGLLFCYCLFILYGSFIPFRLTNFAPFVRSQWEKFWNPPFVHGARNFSILDIVSNILLFVPFGFLYVGSTTDRSRAKRLSGAFFCAGSLGFFFGLASECGQLFSPGRTSSLIDAICNGMGAALGGTAAYLFFRGLQGRLRTLLLRVTRERPSLILLAVLLVVPMASAFYPFQITLDVSTAWENVKRMQWVPFARGFHRFSPDLVVEKVFVFAAAAFLVLRNLSWLALRKRSATAWAVVTLFSLFTEAGKLLFVGRVPNVENVVLSSIGALLYAASFSFHPSATCPP